MERETLEIQKRWNGINTKIKAPGFCSCYSSPARNSLLGHLGHLLHLGHLPFVLQASIQKSRPTESLTESRFGVSIPTEAQPF